MCQETIDKNSLFMYNDYKVLYRFLEEEMKIKRLIALAFALIMALCLVSCGGGKNPPANDGDLEFVSNGDGTCYVSGIGELAAAENIVIPEGVIGYGAQGAK